MDNDFPDAVNPVDKDAAEQRVTEPATHDDDVYLEQLDNEDES